MEWYLTKAQVLVLARKLHWTMLPTKDFSPIVEGSGARISLRRQGAVQRFILQGYAHDGRDVMTALRLLDS